MQEGKKEKKKNKPICKLQIKEAVDHRSSGVGEVIQTIMDKNNIQRSAFPSKRKKEISILTDLRSPLQRSEQHERSCKLTHIVILTHNAVRHVTNLLCQSTVLG